MLVREVMSSPVVTVDESSSLDVAVGRMLQHGVGSLVTVEGGIDSPSPAGIVTATDVLRAVASADRAPSELDAGEAASHPLHSVEPDRTVGHAVTRMVDESIKHLPVVDALDVVGMVTLTDVALHYDDLREEAIDLVSDRPNWTVED